MYHIRKGVCMILDDIHKVVPSKGFFSPFWTLSIIPDLYLFCILCDLFCFQTWLQNQITSWIHLRSSTRCILLWLNIQKVIYASHTLSPSRFTLLYEHATHGFFILTALRTFLRLTERACVILIQIYTFWFSVF